MIPIEEDLKVFRGVTFQIERVHQVKVYNYDPEVHNAKMDRMRSHEQNLEHYGFDWAYIDFLAVYDKAELIVTKPWIKTGQAGEPLLELSLESGDIELTDTTVKVTIHSPDTQDLDFDSGVYKLKLINSEALVPEDQRSGVEPNDQVDCLLYGKFTVYGERE
jgi:hypothetical protein